MDIGALVWVPHPVEVWHMGHIVAKVRPSRPFLCSAFMCVHVFYDMLAPAAPSLPLPQTDVDGSAIELVVAPDRGPHMTFKTRYLPESSDTELVKMSNSDSLTAALSRGSGESPSGGSRFSQGCDEEVSDLVTLMHLNEPSILHVLHVRFGIDRIYTYSGRILLALNPCRPLPLYTPPILSQYFTAGQHAPGSIDAYAGLPPHVFALTDFAFRCMVGGEGAEGPPNQSMLVSGESGAGKTETTKIVLRFLTEVAREAEKATIAEQVLKSNPILEAFGNAKTTRNENSSRFGKFILLQFSKTHTLCGAMIRT